MQYIKMLTNTHDHRGQALGCGEVIEVVDGGLRIHAKDARLLVDRELAVICEADGSLPQYPPISGMHKADIIAELSERQIVFDHNMKKDELAAILEKVRKQ
jgi:hypothetical protein